MKTCGEYTRIEILTQTRAWQEALEIADRAAHLSKPIAQKHAQHQVHFTGCGSTYYLSLAAAAHLRNLTAWRAQAVPASELWLDPQSYFHADDLLIAVSRSGTTTETLRAVDIFCAKTHGTLVTIQCVPGAALAQRGTVRLVIPEGEERSTVQTRSFASMFLAAVSLNAHWAGRGDLSAALSRLPQIGERVLDSAKEFARTWGTRSEFDRIYFLGSGVQYGLACEASLKMKEMSLSHSEPFHFFEFRHGPKSMVTETTLVVGLVSEYAQIEETRVLREMSALGTHVIALGEHVEKIGDGVAFSFESGLPESTRDVLYLPPLQLLAFERALAKGLDPDEPRHLDAVVILE